MNKRIQEMVEEAKLNATLVFNKEGLEHFAELIILECAEMFEGIYTDEHPGRRIDTRIKQHFGVEE
jgi:hypothetical protein